MTRGSRPAKLFGRAWPGDSDLKLLKLFDRRQRGLHQLGLPTVPFERRNQVADACVRLAQGDLHGFGLAEYGSQAGGRILSFAVGSR